MLPGRKYQLGDLLPVLRRWIWVLLVPFAVVAAATALWARRLPDVYRSEAVILFVPQQVSEAVVKSVVVTHIEDRLESIKQQILSRDRLDPMIREFDLYPAMRQTARPDEVIDRMRRDIGIEAGNGDTFKVSYMGPTSRLAYDVTSRLTSSFIAETSQERAAAAEGGTKFLQQQLDDVNKQLTAKDAAIAAYRRAHPGELPTQEQATRDQLAAIRTQLIAANDALARDTDQRDLVKHQMSDLDDPTMVAALMGATPAAVQAANAPITIAEQLDAERKKVADLRARGYQDEFPDLKAALRNLADLQERAKSEPGAPVQAASPMDVFKAKKKADYQREIDAAEKRMAAKTAEITAYNAQINDLNNKLTAMPTRESELTDLTRGYEALQNSAKTLQEQIQLSKVSANAEQHQIGDQYKLQDAPVLTDKPYSPNRQRITLFGMAGGLVLGVGFIVLLEYRDGTFRSDDEVERVLELPVLAVVPVMESDDDRRRASVRRGLLRMACVGTVVTCLAIVVYTFVR